MSTVPVIHLQNSTAPGQELVAAFRTVGFAYLEGHGVSEDLQARLEQTAAEFFGRPVSEKMKFEMKTAGRAWRGYFPPGGELTGGRPDRKEGFYFGIDHSPLHPNVVKRVPTFGVNPWASPKMQTVVTAYMTEMKRVALQTLTLIAGGLGLDATDLEKLFTGEPTEFFRIFGYQKHEYASADDEWGVREHTDMGFLTILKQDRSGGLQAKSVNGEWLDIPPRENAFVLNIGDMLEFWTGGVLRSTPHRVRNLSTAQRFSYPYFFDPNWNASLMPIAPAKLAHFDKISRVAKRWDNLELHALSPDSTYGDFVWKKISKVFPGLADSGD